MTLFKMISVVVIVAIAAGCATSRSSSKVARLEKQGQWAQAAQLQEQIATEKTGKAAAKAWYHAGLLWMDPNNPQKSYKRALTCFNRVDRAQADKQTANNTRLWISVITQLASAKQKASSLKETAAALKDAATGSERLQSPTPVPSKPVTPKE